MKTDEEYYEERIEELEVALNVVCKRYEMAGPNASELSRGSTHGIYTICKRALEGQAVHAKTADGVKK